MKILLFADTHLGFDYPIRPRIERRRRGTDFFQNYQHILDTALTEKVDVLLHGGDVFFRSKIPSLIVEKAYEPLLKVLDQGIDIFLVPGNHERSRLPHTPLFHHPKLHLFDRPRTFTVERSNSRIAFGGIPNIRHDVADSFAGAVHSSGIMEVSAEQKLLCLHQSIENAVVGVQNYKFRKGPDVIGLDQFPAGMDLIVSGHIHRQQILTSLSGTPIIYPGSIERTSFAERLESKGYYMIEISEARIDIEFRPLSCRPMIEWLLNSCTVDESSFLQQVASRVTELPEDAILRIKCTSEGQQDLLKIAKVRTLFPTSINVEIAPFSTTRAYHPVGYA
ncbi:MAG: metallophosphoesterase [Candidatus Marinimicrobia bacterium]|nr:metallophosphoesterase [Candidatus Neomarinimicrobiota bacterium]